MACSLAALGQSQPLPVITNVEQIRELSAQQAALGYPVRIRGVVTGTVPSYYPPYAGQIVDYFFQDSTAGIFVEGDLREKAHHHFGDLVEVTGVTGAGNFAPVIREKQTRVLGQGTLPPAPLLSMGDISSGQKDGQWGKIRGVIRRATVDRAVWHVPTLILTLADAHGEFEARVSVSGSTDPTQWIGREVVLEGVCGSLFNDQRQMRGVLFYVPGLDHITIEAPAQEVPFGSLMQFSPRRPFGERARVRGVVAYYQRGVALYLQDGQKGLRVLTVQESAVKPGDVVDASGFPAVGESAPVLEDAVFTVVGSQPPPQPIILHDQSPTEQLDGALVQMEGTVLAKTSRPEGMSLTIQSKGQVFDALMPDFHGDLDSVPVNGMVRLKGICLVQSGGIWRNPVSFRLLIPSLAAIELLSSPSWWNASHTMAVLIVTSCTLLLCVAWVTYLGRRVREQIVVIQNKIKSGAVLQERNRIARELHDSLEQELVGITMQLDLAAARFEGEPALARNALDVARSMGRHSMLGARKSVWDLRCRWLENGDLTSAIQEAIKELSHNPAEIKFQVSGVPVNQPVEVEMNILRIAQEAVANAVKHARPSRVHVALEYGAGTITLQVDDDGCGFAPGQSHYAGAGHFGMLDIRERANAIHGKLSIQSESGAGTCLRLVVPLS